jgi:hypothetical protein
MADEMNGIEYYDSEFDTAISEYSKRAKRQGLVILLAHGDDCIEFRGGITREIDAWGGITIYLKPPNRVWLKRTKGSSPIEAIYDTWDADGYLWVFNTDIPHFTFDVFKQSQKFCRGIVFALSELQEKPTKPDSPWISVKDRLPEKNKWVLVYYGCTPINQVAFFDGKNFKRGDNSGRYEYVSHWMPLPVPPEVDNG